MAIVYADEVRQDLKSTKQRLKTLSDQWADHQKERIRMASLLDSLRTLGQRGPTLDHALPSRKIEELDRKIATLEVKIGREQKGLDALQAKLSSAPKRPKIRSNVASIAASGSREINAKARQFDRNSLWTTWKPGKDRGTPQELLWAAGMAGAKKTARDRYQLDAVPAESELIMKRALQKNLKKRKMPSRPQ
jgi:hypothetical protein